jgi:transposase
MNKSLSYETKPDEGRYNRKIRFALLNRNVSFAEAVDLIFHLHMGASKGAPDAVQVADRFHLQKNLSEAVERIFHRHREALQQIMVAGSASSSALVTAPIPRPERQAQRKQTRSKRMQRYEAVRELYLQGTGLSEIARRFHMGRMTVQKFAYADTYPETAAYRVKAGMLHPYEAYLRERWQLGCRNGAKLYREVVAMGYPGKRKQVARFVAHLRTQTKAGVTDYSAQPQGLTPRAAVRLLMRRPENLTEEQQQAVIQMRQVHPEIEQLMQVVESFLQMLRTLQGQQLEDWMERVQQSNIREMQNFVEKLRQDRDAVEAGLTLSWSNGVVEGHVNRLKCLKRTMYGRAKFDLLRQRVLYRSPSPQSGSFHAMCG